MSDLSNSSVEKAHIIVSDLCERFARGWHCLGLSEQFRDGKPHTLEAFGTQLVVFEGEYSKKLNVLNAFCPHLGANLGGGSIKGDTIACPFHDWRWAGDGKCAAIPYAKRLPLRARTQSFTTCEENQQLFVWHDPEGNPPPPGVIIPRIEGAFSTDWSDWDWSIHEVDTNSRELVDNLVDVAHFFYVHGEGKGAACTYFKNVFEDHFATQYMEMGPQPAASSYQKDAVYSGDLRGLDGYSRGETTYHGPSYLVARLMSNFPGGDPVESYEVLAHYPVHANKFILLMGFITLSNPTLSAEQNAERATTVAQMLRDGTLQDVHIWKTKARIDNPLLCDSDGPLYQLRRWYQQFFVDVADVKPEMVNLFEAETDTRHALPIWDQQAAQKIAEEARQAAAART